MIVLSLNIRPSKKRNFDFSNVFFTFEMRNILIGVIRSQNPCTDFLLEFNQGKPFALCVYCNGGHSNLTRSECFAAGSKGLFLLIIMRNIQNQNTLFYAIYQCIKTDRSITSNEALRKARENNGEENDLFNLVCHLAGIEFQENLKIRPEYHRIVSGNQPLQDSTYQLIGLINVQCKTESI